MVGLAIKMEGASLARLTTAGIATRIWVVVPGVWLVLAWIPMAHASNAEVPTAGAMNKVAAMSVKRGGVMLRMPRV